MQLLKLINVYIENLIINSKFVRLFLFDINQVYLILKTHISNLHIFQFNRL